MIKVSLGHGIGIFTSPSKSHGILSAHVSNMDILNQAKKENPAEFMQ